MIVIFIFRLNSQTEFTKLVLILPNFSLFLKRLFLLKKCIAKLITNPLLRRDLARGRKSCYFLFHAAALIKLHILTYSL